MSRRLSKRPRVGAPYIFGINTPVAICPHLKRRFLFFALCALLGLTYRTEQPSQPLEVHHPYTDLKATQEKPYRIRCHRASTPHERRLEHLRSSVHKQLRETALLACYSSGFGLCLDTERPRINRHRRHPRRIAAIDLVFQLRHRHTNLSGHAPANLLSGPRPAHRDLE